MRPKQIQELVRIVEQSSIDEIEIKGCLGQRIRIRKNLGANGAPSPAVEFASQPVMLKAAPTPPAAPVPAAEAPTPQNALDSRLVKVLAPMVGTFYRAPSPDADPFVKEGDVVSKGQTLCIIEAMKLMNEIESEVSGKVVKILVDNAQPIEYNQPLFLIDPS